MCRSVIVVTAVFFVAFINADSSEDPQTFTYYAPPTLNFQDIANDLALLDDSTMSNLLDVDSFHIKNVPADFVEFQPHTGQTSSITTTQNSTSVQNATNTIMASSTSSTSKPAETPVKVLPIKRGAKYQRGVLDLLFPATRVKNFKSVFDTVRRLLSYTF